MRPLYALVGALAILPYLNSLQNGFTFDDLHLIRDNPMIHNEPPLRLFATVYYPGGLYRPLTMLTYVANAKLGDTPVGYHAVNVLLHALVSVAAFPLARILLRSTAGAVATAALFAVHPIHTEAVANVVGRAELLTALLILSALLSLVHAEGVRTRRWVWRTLSVGAFAAAVLSKESGFTAIPLLGLVAWWNRPQMSQRRLMFVLLPYIAVGLGYLGLRMVVVGSLGLPEPPHFIDNPLAYMPWLPRLRTALVILSEYLSQLTVPLYLSADYSFNQLRIVTSPYDLRVLIATAVFAALATGFILAVKRAPALAVAACFVTIPLALTANMLFPIGTIKAERLLYLPSFGWCLAVGWLIAQASPSRRTWSVAVLTVVVLAFAGRTWARNLDWRNNLTLFSATVESSPDSAKAHYNLGIAFHEAGRLDDAIGHYQRSLAIYPDSPESAFAIGRIYERKGLDAGAVYWYAKAIRLDWDFAKPHLNTGIIRYRHGEYTSAEAALRTGLAADPDNPSLILNLCVTLLAQGNLAESALLLDSVDPTSLRDPDLLQVWEGANRALTMNVGP